MNPRPVGKTSRKGRQTSPLVSRWRRDPPLIHGQDGVHPPTERRRNERYERGPLGVLGTIQNTLLLSIVSLQRAQSVVIEAAASVMLRIDAPEHLLVQRVTISLVCQHNRSLQLVDRSIRSQNPCRASQLPAPFFRRRREG